jgi:hypothetical protein
MLVFGLSCGCSKKKQAATPPSMEISAAEPNSVDSNTAKLDRAIQKTKDAQSGERRSRE